MTIGRLVFCSGLGLLGFTVILMIFFLVKRPKYIPENAVYESTVTDHTQRLRNDYPTERETIRRESVQNLQLPPTELVETEKLERETSGIFE